MNSLTKEVLNKFDRIRVSRVNGNILLTICQYLASKKTVSFFVFSD